MWAIFDALGNRLTLAHNEVASAWNAIGGGNPNYVCKEVDIVVLEKSCGKCRFYHDRQCNHPATDTKNLPDSVRSYTVDTSVSPTHGINCRGFVRA